MAVRSFSPTPFSRADGGPGWSGQGSVPSYLSKASLEGRVLGRDHDGSVALLHGRADTEVLSFGGTLSVLSVLAVGARRVVM